MPSNDPKKQRKMNIKKYSIAAGIMSLLFGALAYSEPPKQQFPEYPQNGAIATESGAANANGQNASGVQGNVQGNIQGNTVHGDLANTKVQGTLINNTYSGTQITFQGGTNAVNVNTGAGTQIGTQIQIINNYNALPAPQNTNADGNSNGTIPRSASGYSDQTVPSEATPASEVITDSSGQKYTEGLKLHVWKARTQPAFKLGSKISTGNTIGTMTVKDGPPFSLGAILDSPTLKNYHTQELAFMWDAYIQINKKANYVVIMELYNKNPKVGKSMYCWLYLDDECATQSKDGYAFIRGGEFCTLALNMDLPIGMHKLQIPIEMPKLTRPYPYNEIVMRIRLKGPDDEEAVELKATDFYYSTRVKPKKQVTQVNDKNSAMDSKPQGDAKQVIKQSLIGAWSYRATKTGNRVVLNLGESGAYELKIENGYDTRQTGKWQLDGDIIYFFDAKVWDKNNGTRDADSFNCKIMSTGEDFFDMRILDPKNIEKGIITHLVRINDANYARQPERPKKNSDGLLGDTLGPKNDNTSTQSHQSLLGDTLK